MRFNMGQSGRSIMASPGAKHDFSPLFGSPNPHAPTPLGLSGKYSRIRSPDIRIPQHAVDERGKMWDITTSRFRPEFFQDQKSARIHCTQAYGFMNGRLPCRKSTAWTAVKSTSSEEEEEGIKSELGWKGEGPVHCPLAAQADINSWEGVRQSMTRGFRVHVQVVDTGWTKDWAGGKERQNYANRQWGLRKLWWRLILWP